MQNPIRLLVHGASGRMGQAVLRLAQADPRFSIAAAVSHGGAGISDLSAPSIIAANLRQCPAFDVAIGFSLAEGLPALVTLCRDRGAGLVSGTTGIDEQLRAMLVEAGKTIPVVWASNFSLGVAVLEDLARQASLALQGWQVEIIETHHVHKLDAPSGTALTLAKAVGEASGRVPSIKSRREGEVVGEHVVTFAGIGETLQLRHDASSRDIFARGALEAAAQLHGRSAAYFSFGELLRTKNVSH